MFKEITIIGGAGHVGLAFALICGSANIKVHIHDNNLDSIKLIQKGKMPHIENNANKVLKKGIISQIYSFAEKRIIIVNDLMLKMQ